MYQPHIPQCTILIHFCYKVVWDICLMHCGICERGLLSWSCWPCPSVPLQPRLHPRLASSCGRTSRLHGACGGRRDCASQWLHDVILYTGRQSTYHQVSPGVGIYLKMKGYIPCQRIVLFSESDVYQPLIIVWSTLRGPTTRLRQLQSVYNVVITVFHEAIELWIEVLLWQHLYIVKIGVKGTTFNTLSGNSLLTLYSYWCKAFVWIKVLVLIRCC